MQIIIYILVYIYPKKSKKERHHVLSFNIIMHFLHVFKCFFQELALLGAIFASMQQIPTTN